MKGFAFKRHLVVLGICILAIGVVVPIATFAQTKPGKCPQGKLCPLPPSFPHPKFAPLAGALTVNTVYTTDGNGNVASTFPRGAGIQYVVYVTNSSGNPITSTLHFEDYWGTIDSSTIQIEDQIFSSLTIPTGLSGWYVSSTVPTNALPGAFTDRVFVWDQNNYQNQDTGYGSFTVTGSVLLSVPYYTQYKGQNAQNNDCGPASVAMTLKHYGRGPGGSRTALTQIRQAATGGNTRTDTNATQLEAALSYYGSSYYELSASDTPAPDFQMTEIAEAIEQGQPVIGLINAYDFGRSYNGHWLVVTGFSSNGTNNYVLLNDPDNQNPKRGHPNWIKGGQISVLFSTFRQAEFDGQAGPYSIVVSS